MKKILLTSILSLIVAVPAFATGEPVTVKTDIDDRASDNVATANYVIGAYNGSIGYTTDVGRAAVSSVSLDASKLSVSASGTTITAYNNWKEQTTTDEISGVDLGTLTVSGGGEALSTTKVIAAAATQQPE